MVILASSFISRSNLENVRYVDIVQLIVFGMLLGIVIANLKSMYNNK